MRLLLDTHALLWWIGAPEELAEESRAAIADGANEVFVSAASVWEISIKRAAGKLETPDDLEAALEASALASLPITAGHAYSAGALPPHHRDPFDRMLVAQALADGLTIVTRDSRFAQYGVAVLDA